MPSSSQSAHVVDDSADRDAAESLPFLTRAIRLDPELLDRLPDSQIIRILQDTDAEIAHLQAIQMRGIASIKERRPRDRTVSAEIALALSITENRAGAMISAAEALTTRLPRTFQLMSHGVIDLYRAMKVTESTIWLSDEHARIVDVMLENRLASRNANQIRRAAAYAAAKTDPDGSVRRTAHRRAERRFHVHHQPSGVSHLSIDNAPAEKAIAAYQRVDQTARALKTDKESRTLDQLRADVAVDLLLSAPGGDTERAEVFIYLDLATYLGLNDEPAELAGHGHIPAALARRIAAGPNTALRRIITDPLTGQPTDLSATRCHPTPAMNEFIRVRDRECRQPGCSRPAQNCTVEPTIPQGQHAEAESDPHITYCERHRRLKRDPAWQYTVANDALTITTPAGQTHTSAPPPLHQPRPHPHQDGRAAQS